MRAAGGPAAAAAAAALPLRWGPCAPASAAAEAAVARALGAPLDLLLASEVLYLHWGGGRPGASRSRGWRYFPSQSASCSPRAAFCACTRRATGEWRGGCAPRHKGRAWRCAP
jgi:hypothetical protein